VKERPPAGGLSYFEVWPGLIVLTCGYGLDEAQRPPVSIHPAVAEACFSRGPNQFDGPRFERLSRDL
jgi:hypothetical protein